MTEENTAAIELLNQAGIVLRNDDTKSPHLDRAFDLICEAIGEIDEAE